MSRRLALLLVWLPLLLTAVSVHAQTQHPVICAQGTIPCANTQPPVVGIGDPLALAFGKLNQDMGVALTTGPANPTPTTVTASGAITAGSLSTAGQMSAGSSVIGSPIGGNCGAGCLNAQSGVQIGGVPVPSYPRTSAEISASVIPTAITNPTLNALRYGCLQSGDDTACLTQAVAVANALGGATILLPCGTYHTTGVTIAQSNTYIQGTPGCTIVQVASTNTPAFTWGNGSTQYFNGGVSDVAFTGKSGVTGVSGQAAVLAQKIGNFRLANVSITSTTAALFKGIILNAASNSWVINDLVSGCTSDGITYIATVDIYTINSHSDSNGGSGWVLDTAQGPGFTNDVAFGNAVNGWRLQSSAPGTAVNKNIPFVDLVADTSGNDNVLISDCRNCYFINPWGSSQLSTGANTSAAGFHIATNFSQGIYFTGGAAINNNGDGVLIDSSTSAPAFLSFVNFQSGSTVNGGNGNGQSGTGYGLENTGSATNITWTAGSFQGNATAPLNLASSASLAISGNPMGLPAQISVPYVANAANVVTLQGATTGNGINIAATGSDTNINLALNAKGTGTVVANQTLVANAGASVSGAFSATSGQVKLKGVISSGGTFTIASGCTATGLTGGPTAGQFTASTTTCSPVINLLSAPTGWHCKADDQTTGTASFRQTASTGSTVTLTGTGVAASDVISFDCQGY